MIRSVTDDCFIDTNLFYIEIDLVKENYNNTERRISCKCFYRSRRKANYSIVAGLIPSSLMLSSLLLISVPDYLFHLAWSELESDKMHKSI